MLCSFALIVSSFSFVGPEESHWDSGQLRYLFSSPDVAVHLENKSILAYKTRHHKPATVRQLLAVLFANSFSKFQEEFRFGSC